MSDPAVVQGPSLVERLMPGQTHADSTAMLGRGSLVFFGGMAVAVASIFFEQAVIRGLRKL